MEKKREEEMRQGNLFPEEQGYETIEIDLSDEVFLTLSREAHEQDITFNQLCINIIKERIYEDTGEAL